jgi:hypothetical protein
VAHTKFHFMLSDGFADQFLPFPEGTRTHMFFSHLFEIDCFGSMFSREAAAAGGNHSWFSLTIFSLLSTFRSPRLSGRASCTSQRQFSPCAHVRIPRLPKMIARAKKGHEQCDLNDVPSKLLACSLGCALGLGGDDDTAGDASL